MVDPGRQLSCAIGDGSFCSFSSRTPIKIMERAEILQPSVASTWTSMLPERRMRMMHEQSLYQCQRRFTESTTSLAGWLAGFKFPVRPKFFFIRLCEFSNIYSNLTKFCSKIQIILDQISVYQHPNTNTENEKLNHGLAKRH